MLEPALACVERELVAAPENGRLHAQKGHVLKRLGRHDEAVVSLREALRLDSSDDGSRRVLAEVYLERERYEELEKPDNAPQPQAESTAAGEPRR